MCDYKYIIVFKRLYMITLISNYFFMKRKKC